MKKVLLLLFVLQAFVFTAKAQLGYGYAQYGLGFGTGLIFATTDVPYQKIHPSYNLNASYNLTPFTSFTFDFEFGKLSGGYADFYNDKTTPSNFLFFSTPAIDGESAKAAYGLAYDNYYRSYTNNFQSFTIHGDVQLGEFIDYENGNWMVKSMKNFYFGAGIGMIYNNITSIRRYNADTTYAYGGKDHSNNVVVPLRMGYNIKLYNAYDEPYIQFEVGYTKNLIFGYGLDGYSDPIFTSRSYEMTDRLHIGVKFNFGSVTSYRKQVH